MKRNGSIVVHALVFGAVALAVTLAGRGLVQSNRTAVRGLAESRMLVRAARSAIAEAVAHLDGELALGAELSLGQDDSVTPLAARAAFGPRVEIGAVRVTPVRLADATFFTGGLVDLTVTVRAPRAARDRAATITVRHGFSRGTSRLQLDPVALRITVVP